MIKKLVLFLLLPVLLASQAAAETVLITGSNKGIGLAFTKAYLERGATVIATARKPNKADDLKALKETYGDKLIIEQLDVTDDKRIAKLAEQYKDTPIDLLLNLALPASQHMGMDSQVTSSLRHPVALLGHQTNRFSFEFRCVLTSLLALHRTPPYLYLTTLIKVSVLIKPHH